MKIIAAIEIVFWMLVLYALVRQIILPLWHGERMFPFLRRRRDLEVALRDVRTQLTDQELAAQIEAEKNKLNTKNKTNPKAKP